MAGGTKKYSVEGFFPEARAHRADQTCVVVANDLAQAAKAGMKELRKRKGISGHPITTVRLTVRFIGKVEKPQGDMFPDDGAECS